ncbi:helix-turn-helix domain-containing protein [Halorarum halobium]|uniref:helix-turn-helix domain-containing protein n=1 Tax=Halorarum halobium TaxID=3075121 RepID=UPI0028B114B9|nr:helix-turn-helix domain-containing protein [Halobaculum sp. XH14]
MTTIVRATLPAGQFALENTFQRVPSAEFEIVRVVANSTDRVLPLLWATADDGAAFDSLPDAVREDPTTREVSVVTEFDTEYLLKLEWEMHVRVLFYVLQEEDATILDARTKADDWHFRILFPEHDSVASMYQSCQEYDVSLDIKQITQLSDSFRRGWFGLTEHQYETIVGAYREGYYAVPREANLEELAGSFGVSHQALSERLRRGHEKLIANAMHLETSTV